MKQLVRHDEIVTQCLAPRIVPIANERSKQKKIQIFSRSSHPEFRYIYDKMQIDGQFVSVAFDILLGMVPAAIAVEFDKLHHKLW